MTLRERLPPRRSLRLVDDMLHDRVVRAIKCMFDELELKQELRDRISITLYREHGGRHELAARMKLIEEELVAFRRP